MMGNEHEVKGGQMRLTVPQTNTSILVSRGSTALLRFFVDDAGQIDAEYDPADLTEAAELFIAELRRVQSPHVKPVK